MLNKSIGIPAASQAHPPECLLGVEGHAALSCSGSLKHPAGARGGHAA